MPGVETMARVGREKAYFDAKSLERRVAVREQIDTYCEHKEVQKNKFKV